MYSIYNIYLHITAANSTSNKYWFADPSFQVTVQFQQFMDTSRVVAYLFSRQVWCEACRSQACYFWGIDNLCLRAICSCRRQPLGSRSLYTSVYHRYCNEDDKHSPVEMMRWIYTRLTLHDKEQSTGIMMPQMFHAVIMISILALLLTCP